MFTDMINTNQRKIVTGNISGYICSVHLIYLHFCSLNLSFASAPTQNMTADQQTRYI